MKTIERIKSAMQSTILMGTLGGTVVHALHDHDMFRAPSSRMRAGMAPSQNERPGENERYNIVERPAGRRVQPKIPILIPRRA